MMVRPSKTQIALPDECGFTLLEMAFVLLIVGIVVSMIAPTMTTVHHKTMGDEDRKALTTIKDVLIGQFIATGKLPRCLNAAGSASVGNCDTVKSLDGIGVRVTDSRNSPIAYDVANAGGVDLTTGSLADACSRLSTAIATPTGAYGPAICAQSPDYDNSSTWSVATGYCVTQNRVAFVLVGTGNIRPGQNGESALPSATAPSNRNIGADRVFENPSRRFSERWYYDDQVEVVTFAELLKAVSKFCP